MRVPLEISYHGVEDHSDVDGLVNEEIAKLEQLSDQVIACRVALESHTNSRPYRTKGYRVRVEVSVPGKELVAENRSSADNVQRSLFKTVVEAFRSLRRQLKSYVQQRRRQVKPSEALRHHARVAQLYQLDGFGFLKTLDGRRIYFHENSVPHGGFSRLELGQEVRYSESAGNEGPQASTVVPIGREGKHVMASSGLPHVTDDHYRESR